MPPSKHAVLSASGAHRWLHCNPSARLELEFADRETEAAAEGTAAHALAEHKLKKALKLRSRKPVSPYDCDEMDAYTDGYVEFVLEQLEEAKALCADPLVLIEQRLDFSCYVPDGFGTGDCLIVADKLLHIIDFKYGQGVLVDAEENPQMMLYLRLHFRRQLFDHHRHHGQRPGAHPGLLPADSHPRNRCGKKRRFHRVLLGGVQRCDEIQHHGRSPLPGDHRHLRHTGHYLDRHRLAGIHRLGHPERHRGAILETQGEFGFSPPHQRHRNRDAACL